MSLTICPTGGCRRPENPQDRENREGDRDVGHNQTAADVWAGQGGYFDGSLELLRELAVTNLVNAALPRLSTIVSKMLPHDALRMACFDRRGQLVVKASTADLPDMTAASERGEVIIEDLRTE